MSTQQLLSSLTQLTVRNDDLRCIQSFFTQPNHTLQDIRSVSVEKWTDWTHFGSEVSGEPPHLEWLSKHKRIPQTAGTVPLQVKLIRAKVCGPQAEDSGTGLNPFCMVMSRFSSTAIIPKTYRTHPKSNILLKHTWKVRQAGGGLSSQLRGAPKQLNTCGETQSHRNTWDDFLTPLIKWRQTKRRQRICVLIDQSSASVIPVNMIRLRQPVYLQGNAAQVLPSTGHEVLRRGRRGSDLLRSMKYLFRWLWLLSLPCWVQAVTESFVVKAKLHRFYEAITT